MPIKYLNPTSRNGTDYGFGGGGNIVEVDPNAPLIHSETDQSFYGYTVNLGGGNDVATLGYGNDFIIGGAGSDTIAGGSGDDTIHGGGLTDATSNKANINSLYGDFQGDVSTNPVSLTVDRATLALTTSTAPSTTLLITISKYLGNDVLFGAGGSANYTNNLYGDAASLSGVASGGNDTLTGGNQATNTLYGDAASLSGTAHGGNDMLTGGSQGTNTLYGDASTMNGDAVAGNDTLIAGGSAANYLYGDAGTVFDNAVMGNDSLTGASGASNIMAGDASGILRTSGNSTSGNDVLIGGTGIGTGNLMYGDATTLTADIQAILTGGNDTLTGGNQATNTLFGDAQNLTAYLDSQVIGGNDILFAGDGSTNTLYGDGQYQKGYVHGGDDTLVSGSGNDTMWGDVATANDGGPITGGADVFEFMTGSGKDTIMDFRPAEGDRIDLTAYGVTNANSVQSLLVFDTANASAPVIRMSDGSSITLDGYLGSLDSTLFKFS